MSTPKKNNSKSKSELLALKQELEASKARLLQIKSESPDGLSDEQQEQLTDVVSNLADVEDEIEGLPKEVKAVDTVAKEALVQVTADKIEIARLKAALEEAKAHPVEAQISKAEEDFKLETGCEQFVHALIFRGTGRFNRNTGKAIREPYVQRFTRGEWDLFQKHAKSLGYVIDKVLHNPFETK